MVFIKRHKLAFKRIFDNSIDVVIQVYLATLFLENNMPIICQHGNVVKYRYTNILSYWVNDMNAFFNITSKCYPKDSNDDELW